MRNSIVIALDENRSLTVKELTFKNIRFISQQLIGAEQVSFAIEDLFGDRLAEFQEVIDSFVQYPDGEGLDDLSVSELEVLYQKTLEVNPTFLALIKKMGLMFQRPEVGVSSPASSSSIEPPLSSSKEGT